MVGRAAQRGVRRRRQSAPWSFFRRLRCSAGPRPPPPHGAPPAIAVHSSRRPTPGRVPGGRVRRTGAASVRGADTTSNPRSQLLPHYLRGSTARCWCCARRQGRRTRRVTRHRNHRENRRWASAPHPRNGRSPPPPAQPSPPPPRPRAPAAAAPASPDQLPPRQLRLQRALAPGNSCAFAPLVSARAASEPSRPAGYPTVRTAGRKHMA